MYFFKHIKYADYNCLWPGQGPYTDDDRLLINQLMVSFYRVADYAPSLAALRELEWVLEANKVQAERRTLHGIGHRDVVVWYDEQIEFALEKIDEFYKRWHVK